ncbi:hypothetical protein CL616_03735 [archaeon]|nr:hypothetical protein [archaeon]
MRRISRNKYIVALIITLAVFVIGVLIGILVTEKRTEFLELSGREQRIDFDSLQLQYLYLTTLSDECSAVNKALEGSINRLEQTRVKLEDYIAQSFTDNKDFSLTKREYMLAEMRYWLLALQTKELCKGDTVSLLYFYSNIKECDECDSQGLILTYLKNKFKDKLLIFSLDSDFIEEPVLEIFKEDYNIEEVPTIIIEDQKFEGLTTKEELEKVICSYYEDKPGECDEL